nr:unnamed protein product [Callosobruchus analis]
MSDHTYLYPCVASSANALVIHRAHVQLNSHVYVEKEYMMLIMATDPVVSWLKQSLPCRDSQIEQLYNLLSGKMNSPSRTFMSVGQQVLENLP